MHASRFESVFGRAPTVLGRAHGRVNLIGEHTDYSGGFVLPLAIPQSCAVALARTPGRGARAWSASYESDGIVEFELGSEARSQTWIDYIQGLTQAARAHGCALSGFEVLIDSDVPPGAGLSSSAALEVAVLRALRDAFGWRMGDVELATMAREAENDFVGAPVGIMDPMAASLASQDDALFLDTRSMEFEKVPVPAAAEVAVVDSGVPHRHAAGEYRARRAECDRAASLAGVKTLRDLFDAGGPVAQLPPPLDRRVRHVLSENRRVLEFVAAFREEDLAAAGELLRRSHQSLRDDFEVSIPELDLLVDLASARPGVFGARMTGGGFGGSIVILAVRGKAAEIAQSVAGDYNSQSGHAATVRVPWDPEREAGDGRRKNKRGGVPPR